jgi:hypothetical protein
MWALQSVEIYLPFACIDLSFVFQWAVGQVMSGDLLEVRAVVTLLEMALLDQFHKSR